MLDLKPNRIDAAAARARCLGYRKRILALSQQVTAAHIAPAFSCVEIVDLIYNALMRWDAAQPAAESADMFLMSKGHGCLIQYVILAERGILEERDLDAYCTPGGRLGAHPDFGTPGVAAATGSLGHGLGLAVGIAYAERLKGTDARVFAVLSDGECQEGSTWEAAMMAANLGLDNLVVFVDCNDFSGLARMSEEHPAFHPLAEKFTAFGFEARDAAGHDVEALFDASQDRPAGAPMAIIANTVKGRGVSYMESVPIWHYRSPNSEEYAQALAELTEISS